MPSFARCVRYLPERYSFSCFVPVVASFFCDCLPPCYYYSLYPHTTYTTLDSAERLQATAIYPVTSTVHHSCSRPASAIKAKQRNASPDRLPITEWWSDPCRLPIPDPVSLSVPGSAKGKQAANLPGPIDKTTVDPHTNRQPASKHTLPPTYAQHSASNTAPLATAAAVSFSPCAQTNTP